MTEGQRHKRTLFLSSLGIMVLVYQGTFSDLTAKGASTKVDHTPSFLIPQTPDPFPATMLNQAFVTNNNKTLSMPTNVVRSCPVTSQVRLVLLQDDHWILESLDIDGQPKTFGGDEYYVVYKDYGMASSTSPTSVAYVRDCHNGRYKLFFVTSPSLSSPIFSGTGTISITLQYSCGIGHLAPPSKAKWDTGGAINAEYVAYNVTAPRMKPFVPPHGIDFGQYNQVVAFGDSTMGHFTSRNLVWPGGNVGAPLNTDTIYNPIHWKDRITPSMLDQICEYVANAMKQYSKVALLVGSGVWDILADEEGRQGSEFHDHRTALRLLISEIRQEFPTLDVYWKSHTAMHIHRVAKKKDWYHLERVFYMSTSRSYDLYRYQKKIMAELNVSMLDLYPATYLSAEHLRKHDGRHYSVKFNRKMLSWFYKTEGD